MQRIWVLITSLFIVQCFDAFAQGQTGKPEYKEGDSWQYKVSEKDFTADSSEALNGNYELAYTAGKFKASFLNGTAKEEVNVSPNEPGEILLLLVGGTQERPDLKYPLVTGQKWTYQYQNTPRGARQSQTRSVEVVVGADEQVTVPAGTFKAIKLVKSEWWTSTGKKARRNGQTTTYFFSSDAKAVIKSVLENDDSGKREIELVTFSLAR